MSMNVNDALAKVPRRTLYIVGTALVMILLLFAWLGVTKGINGISNFFFWRAANAKQAVVDQKLAEADEKQKIIDQTLKDLADSKKELMKAKEARIEAEKLFEDTTKTAKQKVKEFEDLMSATPFNTNPNGVTQEVVCERAKASGSNPALIEALCAK